jgi:hypothetical protein
MWRFAHDDNYKKEKIKEYDDKVKVSINPYLILDKAKQYRGYFDAIVSKHGMLLSQSVKYRTLYKTLPEIDSIVGTSKMDRKIKNLSGLIDYKEINMFLRDKSFIVPKGWKTIDINSSELKFSEPLTEPKSISLGTNTGNVNFKYWMEHEVIPNLKEGFISSDRSKRSEPIKINKFIESLIPNSYDRNPNKNTTISYTTDINMAPKPDSDSASALELLRQSFD